MLVLYFITYQKKNNSMKKILFSALLLTHSFIQAQVDRSIMPKPTEAKKSTLALFPRSTQINNPLIEKGHKVMSNRQRGRWPL